MPRRRPPAASSERSKRDPVPASFYLSPRGLRVFVAAATVALVGCFWAPHQTHPAASSQSEHGARRVWPDCQLLTHIQLPQDAATAATIIRQAAEKHAPLVIHNDLSQRDWQQLQRDWSVSSLTNLLGHLPINVLSNGGDGIRAQFTFADDEQPSIPLSRFLSGLSSSRDMYFEVGSQSSVGARLRDLASKQPVPLGLPSNQSEGWAPVVSLGGASTGLAFHSHGSSWLTVVHGVKLWLLYPPGGIPQTGVEAELLSFKEPSELYSKLSQLQNPPTVCSLSAGQTLFLPSGWHHATLNAGPNNIAVGYQHPGWFEQRAHDLFDLFPSSGLFASQLGAAAYRQHQDQMALMLLSRAVQLEPHNFKYLENLVAFQLGVQAPREALKLAETATIRLEGLVGRKMVTHTSACWVVSHLAARFFEFASRSQTPSSGLGMLADAIVVKLMLRAQKFSSLTHSAQAMLNVSMQRAGL